MNQKSKLTIYIINLSKKLTNIISKGLKLDRSYPFRQKLYVLGTETQRLICKQQKRRILHVMMDRVHALST